MKDFDALQAERLAAEPEESKADRDARSFRLGGRLLYRRKRISGPTIWLVGQLGDGQDETGDATLIMQVLEQMIDEDSISDFHEVMRGQSKDAPAPDQDTLMELMSWLMAEATGRPLEAASPSAGRSNGQASTTPSTGASASAVRRRSKP
jgi:hypothetical protein